MKPRILLVVLGVASCATDEPTVGGSSQPQPTTPSTVLLREDARPAETVFPRSDAAVVPHCAFSVGAEGACVGDLYGSPGVPVDLYVLFDQSGSMATKDDGSIMRIDAVRGAVEKFLADPESKGIGVGIGYFGTQPLSCACTSCNPSDYRAPAVGIATLPENTQALTSSLASVSPTGETPTGAGVRGSCSYAADWKSKHTGREVALLLVTDGEPQAPLTSAKGGCNPTLDDAVEAAATCLAANRVKTYVLGVGPSLTNLNRIAQAGGTSSAYLVQNAGSEGILAALNAIRKETQIPCTLALPSANLLLSTVNVVYADIDCKLTTFPRVSAQAACPAEGGWYFDNPTSPATILLCPQSCERVSAPGGQLQLSIGCDTVIIP
jgi:hypothetical protein